MTRERLASAATGVIPATEGTFTVVDATAVTTLTTEPFLTLVPGSGT